MRFKLTIDTYFEFLLKNSTRDLRISDGFEGMPDTTHESPTNGMGKRGDFKGKHKFHAI